jgi:hypothetical protein
MRSNIDLRSTSIVVLALFAAACGAELDSEEEEDVGRAAMALLGGNALNMNALNMNALNMNALNMNALNMNALDPNSLAAILDPGSSGDLARQLLRYTVSCALDSTQSFSFSWTDGAGTTHAEVYPGLLGLETGWATRSLSTSGERWISACLASRTNWYSTPVTISARGPVSGFNATDPAELAAYAYEEGAFWGNLFGATPRVYACDHVPNAAHSRAQLRDCAAGHVDGSGAVVSCGIIQRLGSCDATCAALTSNGHYHPNCSSSQDGVTNSVITVFLQ